MTPVSHALLPVFLGQRWIPHKDKVPSLRVVMLVAVCGVLPDILSPHLSLDDRHVALSHTLWAFLTFSVLVGLLNRRWPTAFTPSISLLCIAAYGGHLACDAITGGIALFYPLIRTVQGKNYLPYWLWITCDGLLILYVYFVYRWLPLRRNFKAKRALRASPREIG
jgi:membrane-bound metal-dependent hydrolase YbcI (DUF457 family)